MKFIKGMLIGTVIATGVAMMYTDGKIDKRRMMKRGRQIARKLGTF